MPLFDRGVPSTRGTCHGYLVDRPSDYPAAPAHAAGHDDARLGSPNTHKSTEDELDQEFNSLDAQYEACVAYALSQRHEGWIVVPERYDDGGFSGGNMQRSGMTRLMADVAAGKIDIILLYKIDRLTRSLANFAKIDDGICMRQSGAKCGSL